MIEVKEIEKSLIEVLKKESLEWETCEDWGHTARHIAEPVIKCNLAPREARTILLVAGYFCNRGVGAIDIIKDIILLMPFGSALIETLIKVKGLRK